MTAFKTLFFRIQYVKSDHNIHKQLIFVSALLINQKNGELIEGAPEK